MRRLKLFRCAAVLGMAVALAPSTASAQEADTFGVSGTFSMHELVGIVGSDLAAVYANDNEHGWTLTLYGVTYSHDYYYDEPEFEWGTGIDEAFITRVYATSFAFEFIGPDADALNQVVSSQLVQGGVGNGAFLELRNSYCIDPFGELYWWGGTWALGLLPGDPLNGVAFSALGYDSRFFSADEDGYPLVEAQRLRALNLTISDLRPGNSGRLVSLNNFVDIGSTSLPPALRIENASVREGNRGTTRLNLTVKVTQFLTAPVTVDYATADGTALKKSDYTAKSGTLTILPGQAEATIPLAIKGDRKREPDETFTVRLSNAVGAYINDSEATVTILNDD